MSLERAGNLAFGDAAIKPTVNRPFVRALVEGNAKAMHDASAAGENIHQLALDQSDQFEKLLFSLAPGDDVKFLTLYHEELDASTQAIIEKNRAATIDLAKHPIPAPEGNFPKWIGIITFLFMLYLLINLLQL